MELDEAGQDVAYHVWNACLFKSDRDCVVDIRSHATMHVYIEIFGVGWYSTGTLWYVWVHAVGHATHNICSAV